MRRILLTAAAACLLAAACQPATSELTALEQSQQQLDTSIAALEAQCRDAHDEIKQLDAHRQALRAEINETNTSRVRLEANLAQIDEQIDQARREQQPMPAEFFRKTQFATVGLPPVLSIPPP